MARQITYGTIATDASIVTLPMAKANSRIDFDEENDLLQLFVDAANAEIENYIGAPVLQRDAVKISWDHWRLCHDLPFEIRELVSVEWFPYNGTGTALEDGTDFELFGEELNILMAKPEDFHRLVVTCKAGYLTAEIPKDIKRAALLIFSHADTYRENMPLKLNTSAQALLRPYRRY